MSKVCPSCLQPRQPAKKAPTVQALKRQLTKLKQEQGSLEDALNENLASQAQLEQALWKRKS